ncbi:uncharacterized protein METZ01_LOCUS410003 [marine metagenome]|uniref:Uncharacterized protein n=1 Tax=marine metagenome TaxID=408172 RepID=A0A382WEN0_9ZZZZ
MVEIVAQDNNQRQERWHYLHWQQLHVCYWEHGHRRKDKILLIVNLELL